MVGEEESKHNLQEGEVTQWEAPKSRGWKTGGQRDSCTSVHQ